jgi:cytochrome c553
MHVMTRLALVVLSIVLAMPSCMSQRPAAAGSQAMPDALRPVSDFDRVRDRSARSVALFEEAARVIEHPRCLNCHPADRTPTQGDDRHRHSPMIRADDVGQGPPGLACQSCHQVRNTPTNGIPIESIPGHDRWMLAPSSMSWQGRSTGEICRQIKDPMRNGGRTLEQIHEHMAHDTLVGWGWNPGAGRRPAPGSQKEFGELIAAWMETGAACPGS